MRKPKGINLTLDDITVVASYISEDNKNITFYSYSEETGETDASFDTKVALKFAENIIKQCNYINLKQTKTNKGTKNV